LLVLKRSFIRALIVSSFFLMAGSNAAPQDKPRVLIIGDSISLGYTPYVEQSLAGQAVVVHNAGNAQDSKNGLKNLDSWIGDGKWDVISFNFGLWDLCYRRPGPVTQENRDKVNGLIAVPLDEYEKNLDLIAARLKSTGAKVIFQSVTVVPAQEPGRNSEDVARYNRAAAGVMTRLGIPVNDLQSVTAALPDVMRESNSDVHYTEPGYAQIAKSVVKSIQAEL
jgi:lysophospholipase L1-like esterase